MLIHNDISSIYISMDYIPIMQVGYSYEKLGHYLFDCSLFKLFAMAVVAK